MTAYQLRIFHYISDFTIESMAQQLYTIAMATDLCERQHCLTQAYLAYFSVIESLTAQRCITQCTIALVTARHQLSYCVVKSEIVTFLLLCNVSVVIRLYVVVPCVVSRLDECHLRSA